MLDNTNAAPEMGPAILGLTVAAICKNAANRM